MKTKWILIILILLFGNTQFLFAASPSEPMQTNLNMTLQVSEIKIKDARESLFDDTGEFYFKMTVGDRTIRLPGSGEIDRKKNQYIRPTDSGLGNEPFWNVSLNVQAQQLSIAFHGYEEDPSPNSDDDLGEVSVSLDLADYAFLSETTERKLERGDFHVIFTLSCAPVISSTTHPDSTSSYENSTAIFQWTQNYPAIGIVGYSYQLDKTCCTEPDNQLEGTHTSIQFDNLEQGSHWFHIKAQDKMGYWSSTAHFKINVGKSIDVRIDEIEQPRQFQLFQNYPNPFNASTVISYQLEKPEHIVLEIYNVNGKFITRLMDGHQAAGLHSIRWHGTDDFNGKVASGLYMIVLRVGGQIETRKMTLLR